MDTNPTPPHQLRISTPAELKKHGSTILLAARQKLLARWYTTPTSSVKTLSDALDTLHLYLTQEDPAACPFYSANRAATILQNYLAAE